MSMNANMVLSIVCPFQHFNLDISVMMIALEVYKQAQPVSGQHSNSIVKPVRRKSPEKSVTPVKPAIKTSSARVLSDPDVTLKSQGFYRKHTVSFDTNFGWATCQGITTLV